MIPKDSDLAPDIQPSATWLVGSVRPSSSCSPAMYFHGGKDVPDAHGLLIIPIADVPDIFLHSGPHQLFPGAVRGTVGVFHRKAARTVSVLLHRPHLAWMFALQGN